MKACGSNGGAVAAGTDRGSELRVRLQHVVLLHERLYRRASSSPAGGRRTTTRPAATRASRRRGWRRTAPCTPQRGASSSRLIHAQPPHASQRTGTRSTSSGTRLCSANVRAWGRTCSRRRAVAPPVERAAEAALAGPRPSTTFTPVTAGVLERADLAVVGAHDDHRLVEELVLDEVAGARISSSRQAICHTRGHRLLGLQRRSRGRSSAPSGSIGSGPMRIGHANDIRTRLTGRYNRDSMNPRRLHALGSDDRRRAGRRRRHHRHLPALPRGRPASRCACSRPATASAAPGTGTATPAPGSTPRATPTATSSPGAVRRVGVAGALRRSARDRALPQPRRRPVRPAAAHAVRRQGDVGHVRRAVRHLDRDDRDGTRPGPGSSSPRPACSRCRTSPDVPGRDDFRGEQYHTGLWPATPVEFAGKRVAVVGTGVERRAGHPGHRRRGRR